jgi:hypothetical protein
MATFLGLLLITVGLFLAAEAVAPWIGVSAR